MRISQQFNQPDRVIAKNFSLLLALRYLNPIRTHVSVITLISLIGVALGVMVLIVVSSVMDGFEDLVKKRVLGESPHITLYRKAAWDFPRKDGESLSPEEQWRGLIESVKPLPSVVGAYPHVQDIVLIDKGGNVIPKLMRGIDTQDEEVIADLLKLRVEGDLDIGMGQVASMDEESAGSEVCIVSSIFKDEFGLKVGDVLEVISNRNIKQLKPMLDRRGAAAVYQQYEGGFVTHLELLKGSWVKDGEKEAIRYDQLLQVRNFFQHMAAQNIRAGERELLEELVELTRTDDYDEQFNYYEKGRLEDVLYLFKELKEVDIEALDDEEEMQFTELALPKSIRVSGVYRSDKFAPGPPLLVPLHLAQELAGAGTTGSVNGVSLRLKDPYLASKVLMEEIAPVLAKADSELIDADGQFKAWVSQTWMEQHEQQFSLISMQKLMMTIALSFIMLIAVFSIAAVMFTVTIQKKREIGVMKALGATPGQVTSVFALQGVIVGFVGSLLGTGLSLLVLKNLKPIQDGFKKVGFDPFSEAYYAFEVLPHRINPLEMSLVCLGAFVLCSFAAYAPAWFAARADAARSLRNT